MCAYFLFFKCVFTALNAFRLLFVIALWEALVKSCFPVTSDDISGSRSWISNVILQGMNVDVILRNIPQGVSKELKCFMMKCDPFCLYLLLGRGQGRHQVSAFSPQWGIFFFFLDESLRSVSGLTNATWFGFIRSAARPHCLSRLAVWLMQCNTSLIWICLCRC